MARCYIGDWFVLYQISKNVNMYFFRSFMRELRFELTPSRKASFIDKNKTDTLSRTQSPPLIQPPKIQEDEDENSDIEAKSNSSIIKNASAPIM